MLTLPYKILHAITTVIAAFLTDITEPAQDPRHAPIHGDDIDDLVNDQLARGQYR